MGAGDDEDEPTFLLEPADDDHNGLESQTGGRPTCEDAVTTDEAAIGTGIPGGEDSVPTGEEAIDRDVSGYEDAAVTGEAAIACEDAAKEGEAATGTDEALMPTPPETPPAALLVASIQQPSLRRPQTSTEHIQDVLDPRKHQVWQAAFNAGRLGNTVMTVAGEPIDRAKLQRWMNNPKPGYLHRKELPEPPRRHEDLQDHPLRERFLEAEEDHLKSHKEMNSWTEVNKQGVPKKIGILDCMWVYVYKYDKHGRLQKCKARLVVRGDQQQRTNQNTYAATLAGRSFRTLMALSARFDLELIQYDAVNAFVNAQLNEEVYMRMPPGHRRQGTVLRLNKALYGLRNSPLLWHKALTGALRQLGFKNVPHEPCCSTLKGIIIFFYVDDIVVAHRWRDKPHADGLMHQLGKRFQLTGGNPLQWFLGIEIIRDREERLIWLSQASYIDKIVKLATLKPAYETPMMIAELLPYKGTAQTREIRVFQVKVGSLLYAAVITRPDIAFATSRLARFNCNPGPEHQRAADRALWYLYNTRGLALQLGGGDTFEVASDASFADNSIDRKSSQAFAIKLFGGLIG